MKKLKELKEMGVMSTEKLPPPEQVSARALTSLPCEAAAEK
jgi:hypothetical protein